MNGNGGSGSGSGNGGWVVMVLKLISGRGQPREGSDLQRLQGAERNGKRGRVPSFDTPREIPFSSFQPKVGWFVVPPVIFVKPTDPTLSPQPNQCLITQSSP